MNLEGGAPLLHTLKMRIMLHVATPAIPNYCMVVAGGVLMTRDTEVMGAV